MAEKIPSYEETEPVAFEDTVPMQEESVDIPSYEETEPVSYEETTSIETTPAKEFRRRLVGQESQGNREAKNPTSSAQGRFQFVKATGNMLAKQLGEPDWQIKPNDSEEEKKRKDELQERMFDLWEKETLEPAANRLKSLPYAKNFNTSQLKAMVHYLGAGGARKYLQSKGEKDPALGYKDVINMPTSKYLEKFADMKDESSSQPLGTVAGDRSDGGADAPPDGISYADTVAAEPNALEEFFQGLELGARETIAPGQVTEEELKKEQSLAGIAGEMFGAIGIDIAAGAAATKAGAMAGTVVAPGIGTAVGGIAGLLGYAVFSGLAQEELAEKRTGEYSAARAAGRVALAVNPLVRYGGRISQAALKHAPKAAKALAATEKVGVRAARLGAQVAGEAAVAGSEFGGQEAAIAGVASLALHGLAFKAGRKMDPIQSRVIGETAASPAGVNAAEEASKKLAAMPSENLTYTRNKLNRDFARYVNRQDGAAATGVKGTKRTVKRAERILEKMDDEAKNGLYSDYVYSKLLGNELSKARKELNKEFIKRGSLKVDPLETLEETNKKIYDGQTVTQEIDRLAGTGATEILNNISESRGIFENTSTGLYHLGTQAQKIQKKARISNKQMGQLRAYLSEGRQAKHLNGIEHLLDSDGNVSGKVKEAVDAWSKAFDEGYSVLTTMGFSPGYIDTYMPRTMLTASEKASAVNEITDNIRKLVPSINKNNLHAWTKQDLVGAGLTEDLADNMLGQIKDLGKMAKISKQKTLTLDNLAAVQNNILKSKNTRRMGNDVSAVFSKGDELLSDKFREYDIAKAYLGYVNGSVKSAIMADSMRQAYNQYSAFSQAGLKTTAKWWDNLLQDLSGTVREGTIRQGVEDKLNVVRYRMQDGMRKAKENKEFMKIFGYGSLNAISDAFAGWQTAVYPAYLGLNAKATIRNLGQNFFQTAPYLGGTYGLNLVSKSVFQNPWKHLGRLKKAGLIAKGASAEAVTGEATKIGRAYGRVGDLVMKTYMLTDDLNRVWAYNVGHNLAKDIIKGKDEAITALEKMGAGVRVSLRKEGLTSIEAMRGNMDKVGDILGRHMIARTQFHYGNEQKAEFLRDMGPLFSMFTKWPVAVASDMAGIVKENPEKLQAAYRMFERYGAPLSAAILAGQFAGEDNEIINALVGNPVDWAPAMSVTDFSVLNNPVFELALGTVSTAGELAEDPSEEGVKKRMKAAIRSLSKSTVPGASSVLNELDRWAKARGEETVSSQIANELIGD